MNAASLSARSRSRSLSLSQVIGVGLAVVGFLGPWFVEIDGLSPAGHRMLGVFIAAIVLWVTDAVPMHATAMLIILAEVLLLSDKAVLAVPKEVIDAAAQGAAAAKPFAPIKYTQLFAALADPVIILFLGGFFLADGATKFSLDKAMSRVVLKPFGTRPRMVLMGLMLITAVFSMFMSNTATTATMMAVIIPVLAQLPERDKMRAGLALAIPVAANIGGIGTPVGTPPNAIALGQLSAKGIATPTFLQWMLGAVPFMLLFLAIAYVLLIFLFPTQTKEIRLEVRSKFNRSTKAVIFYITFAVTVLLWMTEALHGMNSNVVGFIPVVVMLCFKVFDVNDVKQLDWHVLWLVAGGIALGTGIGATGLDTFFINLFPWENMSATVLVACMALAALIMGTFISHSATTNLLVPIAISLAQSPAIAVSPRSAAIFVAVGSSLAMALPISTPPNAIAFATGEVKTRDMAVIGAIFGALAWLIFILAGPTVFRLAGIID